MQAALVALMLPWCAHAAELSIAVEHIHSGQGTVMIGLYDNAEAFDSAADSYRALLVDPKRYAAMALQAGAADRNTVTLGEVQPGRYAVIAFQDENDNGRLDRNILGLPIEPYGFSNNVRGLFAAPAFDRAAVTIEGSQVLIRITLIGP